MKEIGRIERPYRLPLDFHRPVVHHRCSLPQLAKTIEVLLYKTIGTFIVGLIQLFLPR